jgi:hypothetical protein
VVDALHNLNNQRVHRVPRGRIIKNDVLPTMTSHVVEKSQILLKFDVTVSRTPKFPTRSTTKSNRCGRVTGVPDEHLLRSLFINFNLKHCGASVTRVKRTLVSKNRSPLSRMQVFRGNPPSYPHGFGSAGNERWYNLVWGRGLSNSGAHVRRWRCKRNFGGQSNHRVGNRNIGNVPQFT